MRPMGVKQNIRLFFIHKNTMLQSNSDLQSVTDELLKKPLDYRKFRHLTRLTLNRKGEFLYSVSEEVGEN